MFNKLNILLIVFIFVVTTNVFLSAQTPTPCISEIWNVTFNGGSSDEFSNGVAVDSNSNVYISGNTDNGANLDFRTIKYNSLGVISWNVTFDGGDFDSSNSVAVDSFFNVYVAGESFNGTNSDFRTIKYDSTGIITWNVTYDGGANDIAYGVAVNTSGNVFVTGRSIVAGSSNFRTIKYNSAGSVVWNVTFGGGFAHGIALDTIGNVYVIGRTDGVKRIRTIKYNSAGSVVWNVTFGTGIGLNDGFGVTVDSSGNVYAEGFVNSSQNFITIKYDSTGTVVWNQTFDSGTTSDEGRSIALDGTGDVYVAGQGTNGTDLDFFLLRYDSSGNFLWNIKFDGGGQDSALGVASNNLGNIFITGGSVDPGSGFNDMRTINYLVCSSTPTATATRTATSTRTATRTATPTTTGTITRTATRTATATVTATTTQVIRRSLTDQNIYWNPVTISSASGIQTVTLPALFTLASNYVVQLTLMDTGPATAVYATYTKLERAVQITIRDSSGVGVNCSSTNQVVSLKVSQSF